MRKIEKDMIAAIREGRNWQGGNTTVCQCDVIGDTETEIYLHGSLIAKRYSRGFDTANGEAFQANSDTFRRWPTRTTVSRLRALGLAASIKGGRPHLNGEPI